MELRDIEYFGVIAEHRNMRRAAHALGVTPPALTKSVQRLEGAMEAKLLQRTGRGVELTPFGSALALQARKLRLALDDLTREASDLSKGRAGHLRIGSGPTDAELLPAACTELMRSAPGLTFEILISDNDELVPLVLAGKLDFVLNTIPLARHEGIEPLPVLEDGFVAFASARHALAHKRRLALKDLVGERWATSTPTYRPRQMLVQAFADHGLPEPRFALETRSARLRLQFIASSGLLGFGPRLQVQMAMKRYGLKMLPVKELTLRRTVGIMFRKGAYLPPAAQKLIELLRA